MDDLGQVLVRGPRRELVFSRVLSAPPADVWEAITVPERVARWIGRLETSGSDYVLTFPDEGHPQSRGGVLVCEPTSRLVVTWTHETEAPGELEVALQPRGRGTELRLVHRDLQAVGAGVYGAGWHELLDALAGALGHPVDGAEPFAALLPRYRTLEAAGVAGEVMTSPQGASVVVSRLLEATVDDVWSALTRRDRVGRWLWPVAQWPGRDDGSWEPAVGDRVVFDDANAPSPARFDVLEVRPGGRLVVSWGPVDSRTGTEVTFTVEPEGEATRLVVQQAASPTVVAAGRERGGADFAAGWHALLDALAVLVIGQELPPADELWQAAYRVYDRRAQPTVASL